VGERTVRAGGFRLTVEVPDRVSSALRRALRRRPAPEAPSGPLAPADRLVVRPVPPVPFRRRDPDEGIAFVRLRRQWRADHTREAPPDEVPDGAESLARQVAAHSWYHTLELPHGVVTDGAYDHRPLVPSYGIPADLGGQRVLDVASADGFWAFEFERRGAAVTALEIETTAQVDLPGPMRARAAELGLTEPITEGFALARRVLKSSVEPLFGTIYDLDPERLGMFDLVHTGDVLVHLRDPIAALEQLRRVTRGHALLSDVYDPALPSEAGEAARYLGGGNAAWWRPALGTLVQMVADAGFSDVEVVTTYSLAARGEDTTHWRAVLRATP